MSKLLKLKEWLMVPDAARHLSGICGEPVSEADVLRLGLDGHLTLSVHLVNHARARMGTVVPLEQAESAIFPAPSESPVRVITDLNIDGEQFLHLEKRVVSIYGVWDLAMIGAERLDVEHAYQQLTGGPEVTLVQLNGVFLSGVNGEFAQLQESYESPEMKALSGEIAQKVKDLGVKRDLSKEKRPLDHPSNWFPAGALPEDSVIVVRTSALTDFQALIADEPAKGESSHSHSTREKNTLLRIIGLMASQKYTADIEHPHAIAGHLGRKAAELGVKAPSDDTIAKHLKAARALIDSERGSIRGGPPERR